MESEQVWHQQLRFYARAVIVYGLTVLFAIYALQPLAWFKHASAAVAYGNFQAPYHPTGPTLTPVAGRPVRIVISASAVDLPVDPGYYDKATHAWTLTGYHAQFAMISTLANNLTGDTFIYGHNNNYVFGALRHRTPDVGSSALIYTDNGHVLAYKFKAVTSVAPEDTTVLRYDGPPVLTIQTCTGSLNEWRTMFTYSFDKVVQ